MRQINDFCSSLFGFALALAIIAPLAAEDNITPRGHDKPPGPALSPAEAVAKMTLPPGFTAEVAAAEPDIVNPIAMAFDEKGRIWVTESFEYPRREAGAGRDRVKVLEDTDGDGRYEKVTIFAEGLNIPSGIAVGHGGVWVANAPDLLFLQDTDGDGTADKSEVVVTGFGRDDTHELPNSLTWGPDGYLYGINGVFNYCHVVQDGKTFDFTCALFRIDPRTRKFSLFCEGTSNPWGVTWDTEGSAFISACVIDHLWHLTETGYYNRQGGPYPPHTWKIESIVKHKHQKAAYCGIHYYDSDAYPAEFRHKLYMGNIHGGCLNTDEVERAGSTYAGKGLPDFLTANDPWFMPVMQKTGPDGCLYVLDWYDRYHCYQDANRDPVGIDRLKGRLYRVRYKDTPRAEKFDLSKETDDQLIARLDSGNGLFRELAQRILGERNDPSTRIKLEALVQDKKVDRRTRLHACWTLIGTKELSPAFHAKLLAHEDPIFRAWGVRAAGNIGKVPAEIRQQVIALAEDASPDVKLQVAIASCKLADCEPIPVLLMVLNTCGDDSLIPHIVWQNLHPLLEEQSGAFVQTLTQTDLAKNPNLASLLPRIIDRIIAAKKADPQAIATIFALVSAGKSANPNAAKACLSILAARLQSREITGAQLAALRSSLEAPLTAIFATSEKNPLFVDASLLAATWQAEGAVKNVRKLLVDTSRPEDVRLAALAALVAGQDTGLLEAVPQLLAPSNKNSLGFRGQVLSALGRLEDNAVGTAVLAIFPKLEAELQPRALEMLTQRVAWSKELIGQVAAGKISRDTLGVNQVRKLLALGDSELSEAVTKHWGSIRTERDPAREEFIASMRKLVRSTTGNAQQGEVAFTKLCGQCHKLYGKGFEVGPDITANGRSSFEQLLSNVFDPSLVIGASYQARTVVTDDGRVLQGLLAEDNDQRVVLKMQGGKTETIARADVAQISVSKLSLMPEGIEKQLKPEEIVDLFAFLTLDKHPSDPSARPIPGTRLLEPREIQDPKQYGEILRETLPGFSTEKSGVSGVGLLSEFRGRNNVVRVHPVDMGKPCILKGTFNLPADKKSRLVISTSHHPEGDFQLIVRIGKEVLYDGVVGPKSCPQGWLDLSLDISRFAGKSVVVEVLNQPTGWSFEFAHFSRLEIVSE